MASEHRLQIERRAADDLQDIGGRGLLLQRFAAVSLNSRTFSIAITAWSAKVCSRAICLSLKDRRFRRAHADRTDALPLPQHRHEPACE